MTKILSPKDEEPLPPYESPFHKDRFAPSAKTSLSHLAETIKLACIPKTTGSISFCDKFTDIKANDISKFTRGLIINVYGTILPFGSEFIDEETAEKLSELRATFRNRICFITENNYIPTGLINTGIPTAVNLVKRPDPRAFSTAAEIYLSSTAPKRCTYIGSNYLIDNGALDRGMHYINTTHLHGAESKMYRFLVKSANRLSQIHAQLQSKSKARKETIPSYLLER